MDAEMEQVPPPISSSPSQMPKGDQTVPPKEIRSTLIIATVVVLAVSAAIVAWSFFGLGRAQPSSQSTKLPTQLPQQKTPQANINTITSPISLNNPDIRPVIILYFFTGILQDMKAVAGGTQLITDKSVDGIPSFIVTDSTTIVFYNNDQQTPATINDIKPNQRIGLNIIYHLEKKTWAIHKVLIFIKSSSSTPTPSN